MDQQTVVVRQIEGEDRSEELRLPAPAPANEGKTTAAWTLTLFGCVGATVVALGMVLASAGMIWTGAVILALGAVVSVALRGLGYGQPRPQTTTTST
ncbi:MAG: HGxxPAAW family protein [Beutenbergiaceae bacterium]